MSAVLTSNVKVCFEALIIIKTSRDRSHIEGTNRVIKNSQSFSVLNIFCKMQILLYYRCYSVVCGECPLNQVGSLLCSLYLNNNFIERDAEDYYFAILPYNLFILQVFNCHIRAIYTRKNKTRLT